LTVVKTIYYSPFGRKAVAHEVRFERQLDTYDQSYERIIIIGPEWERLDFGWLNGNVGVFSLSNMEGTFYGQMQPSKEERDAIATRIVEVGIDPQREPLYLVRPGENFDASPVCPERLIVRAQTECARCTLFVVPR